MLEYPSSDKFLETESHQVSQCFGVSTGIHGAICKCHVPTPSAPVHAHITLPPPCFIVGIHFWPGSRQTCWTPSEPNSFPSNQRVCSQYSPGLIRSTSSVFFFSWTPSLEVDYVMQCP